MTTEYVKLPVSDCLANGWNFNELEPSAFGKLKEGIKDLLASAEGIPPIVVRRHPDHEDKFQIIDGWHRVLVFKELGLREIDAYVISVNDSLARILTNTLNYLRGSPNKEKHVDYIRELIGSGVNWDEMTRLLPESEEDLLRLANEARINVNELFGSRGEGAPRISSETPSDEQVFVKLEFDVSAAQAKVIEAEVARVAEELDGSNVRGRALEFMAVNSSLTPLSEVQHNMSENVARKIKSGAHVKIPVLKHGGHTTSVAGSQKQSSAAPLRRSTTIRLPNRRGSAAK